jgi:PmbA protein
MSDPLNKHLQDRAEQALQCLRAAGFNAARAEATVQRSTELNLAHNEPSLLRSTVVEKLMLAGLIDGRMATTELTDLGADAIAAAVSALHADALAAPQDEANTISAGQVAEIAHGPLEPDEALMADKVAELLAFRARETPTMMLEEGLIAHQRLDARLVTSGGSAIGRRIGCYQLALMGTAKEGKQASSFNYTEGRADELSSQPIERYAGIEQVLRDTARQVQTQPLAAKFVGDVVLMPMAAASLFGWLLGQLADMQLIAGSSLYRDRVGQAIASSLLSLCSRFDAPGVSAVSADGCVAAPVDVLRAGQLQCLTPSLYASRKTGLPHVPVAGEGWEVPAGETPLAELVAGVRHGALVGRLSMGNPAPNGDFSGVIKNSFLIEGGGTGPALRETMISGNIARLLQDVQAVSRERIDTASWHLPWLRIGGLHFS